MTVVLKAKHMSFLFKNWIASKTETCHFNLETNLLAKQKHIISIWKPNYFTNRNTSFPYRNRCDSKCKNI